MNFFGGNDKSICYLMQSGWSFFRILQVDQAINAKKIFNGVFPCNNMHIYWDPLSYYKFFSVKSRRLISYNRLGTIFLNQCFFGTVPLVISSSIHPQKLFA